jgi:hypothetical protein
MRKTDNQYHGTSGWKFFICLVSVVALSLTALQGRAWSQVVNESTKKRISIGVGLYSDIWLDMPSDIKARAINQGATVFGTYNVPFGKSKVSFAIGLGITAHNLYGDFLIDTTKNTTTVAFKKIPDSTSYKKSKLNTVYIEIPLELRFKSKSKVTVGLGFKGGFLIGSFWKFVGTGNFNTYYYSLSSGEKTRIKLLGIKNLETFNYGPTLRIGYRWFNVSAYYQLSNVFQSGKGPGMHPISVGFILMPF